MIVLHKAKPGRSLELAMVRARLTLCVEQHEIALLWQSFCAAF
jgi:hypothetical protein